MKTSRIEAFSDGVIAIIITVMVLGLQVPKEVTIEALISIAPVFICYLVSFVYTGIFWFNHHNLFHKAEKVNNNILWANLHLLFWLSLIPFATAWVGENHLEVLSVGFYGSILILSTLAFNFLQFELIKYHKEVFPFHMIIGKNRKEKIAFILYVFGISLCFVNPILSIICYFIAPIIWFLGYNNKQ